MKKSKLQTNDSLKAEGFTGTGMAAASLAPILDVKSAKILWPQLGWNPLRGPAPAEGPVSFVVVSPWCPDCREVGPRLSALGSAAAEARPAQDKSSPAPWLVGEFCTAEETLAFAEEFGIEWPVLQGTTFKSEVARNLARFRQLREAWGDSRRWGVPTILHGELRQGWFSAHLIEDPSQ